MKKNTITSKLQKEIRTLEMGINILKSSLLLQAETDGTIISPHSKEYINLINNNIGHIAKNFIPEQLEYNQNDKMKNLRDANDKIRELESQLSKKVEVSDICYYANEIESNIRDAFNDFGVYASISVSFNSYSILVKLEHIKELTKDDFFSKTQDDIDSTIEINKKNKKIFKENFDFKTCENSSELLIVLNEKNIKKIKEIISKSGFNLDIKNIDTDRFNVEWDIISDIELFQNVNSFNLSMPRNVYQ